jgi:DNA-directed RNA polymerase subunit alpha
LYDLATAQIECIEHKDNFARFAAQPLERGFGNTLGNALRRVLLSSLQGAAVNWVNIAGIQHEFTTVPYMKESVIDFLLNVKAIRLRPLTGKPGKLFLDVEGEGCIYAADIEPSIDFEIVNPELYLATLDSSEAKLQVEFNVVLGRGYVPATSKEGLSIGVIPIDAIFTPIRKVNYTIEPMHIGQQAGYERLMLEVWADGTISPSEALHHAAQILVEQFSVFVAAAKPPQEEGEGELAAIPADQYNLPIDQLGFSLRTYSRLRRNKVTSLGELLDLGKAGFLTLKRLGPKSLEEVEQRLSEMGLTLAAETKGTVVEEEIEEEKELAPLEEGTL